MNKLEALREFLELGILVGPDFFSSVPNSFDYGFFLGHLKQKLALGVLDFFNIKKELQEFIESGNLVQSVALNSSESIGIFQVQEVSKSNEARVIVKKSYTTEAKKKEVQSFVSFFRRRYDSLRKILVGRQELQDSISISRLVRKQTRQSVSVIGLVADKLETKNGNIKLILEDPTGLVTIIVTKTKNDLFDAAKDIMLDEVIGITGTTGEKTIFCNNIILPEIPVNHEIKKSPNEGYVVFISDIHFGIKNFLIEDFMKFISWLRGEYGSDQQREIANKVKYLFVIGDVVEGVGIYPGQENDLDIKDIYNQYEEAAKYFKLIPERIKVIICGGNHDAIRMAEPQPLFDKAISKGFYEIPNMVMVSNPAVVNIDSCEGFPGFDVLMYHGGSFPYYADLVQSIRSKGGIGRCDLIMKYLLQRRHLAPSHGSTLYVPDDAEDPLVINEVPDIFVSGHIHQITVANYRGVSLINSSCWVVQSEDNAKRGIVPHPARIPIMNLKTREIKIMNFLSDDIKVLVSERLTGNG